MTRIVSSGMTASGVAVIPGDRLLVLSGGQTLSTIVSSGGGNVIEELGLRATLLSFVTETVSFDGFTTANAVGSGGVTFVLSGGLALDAAVQAGGSVSGSDVFANGTQVSMSGGMTQNSIVAGDFDIVSAGRLASASVIESGGTETVRDVGGARADDSPVRDRFRNF